jgi:hypothetical protein
VTGDLPADLAGSDYVRLSDGDNVVVLIRHVEQDDVLPGIDGRPWTMTRHLEAGNKLAATEIAEGEQVLKYGFPIGTATQPIEAGAHVHSHNLQSNYIPIESEARA